MNDELTVLVFPQRAGKADTHRRAVTVAKVIAAVATFYGIPQRRIRGRRRFKSSAEARQLAMYLARKHTGASYPELGQAFERHHTTVMHAVEKLAELVRNDEATRAVVSSVEELLGEVVS